MVLWLIKENGMLQVSTPVKAFQFSCQYPMFYAIIIVHLF